ncbi:hypothetical protein DESC_780267 [Desulfosarcina cetonica]|nr:hypothetical protein DESC_780267 [Desulfosarcina cetonica]
MRVEKNCQRQKEDRYGGNRLGSSGVRSGGRHLHGHRRHRTGHRRRTRPGPGAQFHRSAAGRDQYHHPDPVRGHGHGGIDGHLLFRGDHDTDLRQSVLEVLSFNGRRLNRADRRVHGRSADRQFSHPDLAAEPLSFQADPRRHGTAGAEDGRRLAPGRTGGAAGPGQFPCPGTGENRICRSPGKPHGRRPGRGGSMARGGHGADPGRSGVTASGLDDQHLPGAPGISRPAQAAGGAAGGAHRREDPPGSFGSGLEPAGAAGLYGKSV